MEILRRLKKMSQGEGGDHNVFRTMMVLAAGTGAAKTIGLLSIPILTRIYEPDDFGVLSIFAALVLLLSPVVSLRYTIAVPLPKRDAVAFNLFMLSLLCTIVLTAFVGVGVGLISPSLFPLLSMEALLPYWWLIPIGVLGASLYELLQLWATRKKSFKVIARASVGQSVAGNATKIVLGLMLFKPVGLLIGQVVAQSAGMSSYLRPFSHSFLTFSSTVNVKLMFWLMRFYRELPFFRLPSQFLLILAGKAPLFFVSGFYSAEVTGQLALAFLALAIPMELFGATMGKAYYAEVAAIGKSHPRQIRLITTDVIKKLALISLLPTVVLLVASPFLFTLVFGDEWRQAGEFARLLAFYLMFQFISSPLVNVLTVFNKQRVFLYINILRLFIVGCAFGAAHVLELSPNYTIGLYSAMLSFHYMATIWIVFSVVSRKAEVKTS